MLPTPAIACWSRRTAFNEVRRLRRLRYSSSAANAGSMGSGPSRGSFFAESSDCSVPSSRRPNRRGSRYRRCRPSSRTKTACVCFGMGVAGSTSLNCPVIPRWTMRSSSFSRSMRMYFPRLLTSAIRLPATLSMKTSGSGCRTMVGKSSSQRAMVRPARCGLRSATIVSTSGSSGTYHRELFHVRPVRADFRLDLDARLQLVRAGHDARHLLGKLIDLGLRHLEKQLVMDLKQHAAFDLIRLDLALQAHHRDLDDVRGERLHREVDRHPLRGAAQLKVRRSEVRDGAAASCCAHDESLLARLAPHLVQVLLESRVRRPVLREELPRHVARDAQLLRKAVLTLAVDGSEVRDLREATLIRVDRLDRDLEHRGRGGGVDVLPGGERAEQLRVPAQVRGDPELDLRVVG